MRPEIPAIESIRHVHLVAICGTAMGSLACMLVDRGFRVTGSDTDAYPPMSDQLRAAGIDVQKGFAAEHVLSDRPDLVVIGNAVRRENPEAVAAIEPSPRGLSRATRRQTGKAPSSARRRRRKVAIDERSE